MQIAISSSVGRSQGNAKPTYVIVNRDGSYVVNRDGKYIVADPTPRTSA